MILQMFPGIAHIARLQRRFLGRAVRYLAGEAGIRQFLDIGTGLPSADNTHEVAQRAAPRSRIVYVDNDPIVRTHADALLTSGSRGSVTYFEADLRKPEPILRVAAANLSIGKPVALLLAGVLQCIPDDEDPAGIVRRLLAGLAPGSYVLRWQVLSVDGHITRGDIPFKVGR